MPAEMPGPSLRLVVEQTGVHPPAACCAPLLDLAEAALVEAQRLQRLPDNYTDVTQGWFVRGKRWIKRKLLGNFKHAYVDVLSRQQTAVNSQVVTALRELTECCATLDHAVRQLQERAERRQALSGERQPPETSCAQLNNTPTITPLSLYSGRGVGGEGPNP